MYRKYSSLPEHIRLYLDAIWAHIYTFCPLVFSLGSQIHNAAIWANEIKIWTYQAWFPIDWGERTGFGSFLFFVFLRIVLVLLGPSNSISLGQILQLSSYSVRRMTSVVSEVVMNISGIADCSFRLFSSTLLMGRRSSLSWWNCICLKVQGAHGNGSFLAMFALLKLRYHLVKRHNIIPLQQHACRQGTICEHHLFARSHDCHSEILKGSSWIFSHKWLKDFSPHQISVQEWKYSFCFLRCWVVRMSNHDSWEIFFFKLEWH